MDIYTKLKHYLKMPIIDLVLLPIDEIKKFLEILFPVLESRINEIDHNRKNRLKHLETLKNIKFMILQDNLIISETMNNYKINILRQIIQSAENLLLLTADEKIKLIMEYVEKNDIPTENLNLKFSNLKDDVLDDSLVYEWLSIRIFENLEEFNKGLKKYKTDYPNSYKILRISPRLDTMIKCFMEYTETHEIKFGDKLTFGDIGSSEKKNTNIYWWFKNNISQNNKKFLLICKKYKEDYPNAYKRIIEKNEIRENKKKTNSLSFEERLKIYTMYLETNPAIKSSENITFKDIAPNCNDYKNVYIWFERVKIQQQERLLRESKLYEDIYPNGYKKIIEKINLSIEYKKKIYLTNDQAVRVFMKYYNNNEFSKTKRNVKFMDVEPGITDDRLIYNWSLKTVFSTKENAEEIYEKFKNEFPTACEKVKKKMLALELDRKKGEYSISGEEKIKLFMKYIENYPIPTETVSVRFCDICLDIKDEVKVATWLRDKLHRDNIFLDKCAKYKNEYPNAYLKIKNKVEINKLKRQNDKKLLNFNEKVRIFMKFYNNIEEYHIDPTLRFCDIEEGVDDQILVYPWIDRILRSKTEQLLDECSKYASIYPNAYLKMGYLKKEKKKSQEKHAEKSEEYIKKVIAYMQYIEENEIPELKDNITFKDLDSTINSDMNISFWVYMQMYYGYKKFIIETEHRKQDFPNAIQKIYHLREITKKKSSKPYLTYEQRIILIMNYLESKSINSLSKLGFCDLDTTVREKAKVKDWIATQLINNIELFIEEYTKYQDTYPYAYRRLNEKVKKYLERKNSIALTSEERIKIFMNYIEKEDLMNMDRKIKFCDISNNNDKATINNWYHNITSKYLYWFILEVNKYKDIYPNAYQQICNQINNGKVKKRNQRILLIETLKEIKDNISKEGIVKQRKI